MKKEHIEFNKELLSIIIKRNYASAKTEFLTPGNFKQQVGLIVYDV